MKFPSKYALLLTGPLALMSGCGIGPLSGVTEKPTIVSLKHPDPQLGGESAELASSDLDESGGLLSARFWKRDSAAEAEEHESLIQLIAGRRRQQSQMMYSPIAGPLPDVDINNLSNLSLEQLRAKQEQLSRQMQTSLYPGAPVPATSASGAGTAAAQPMMTPMLPPTRREIRAMQSTASSEEEAKTEAKEASTAQSTTLSTPASAEAARVERAAALEAERIEQQAIREAEAAERRLKAEADLIERLARAELELAERVAMAKEDRDRRVEMVRMERESRLALMGLAPDDIRGSELAGAMDRANGDPEETTSGLGRFARFFRRSKPEDNATPAIGAAQGGAGRSGHRPPRFSRSNPIRHSRQPNPYQSTPEGDEAFSGASLAGSAAGFPSTTGDSDLLSSAFDDDRTVASSSGQENLHPSLLGFGETGADTPSGDAPQADDEVDWDAMRSIAASDAGSDDGLLGGDTGSGLLDGWRDSDSLLSSATPSGPPAATQDNVWILDGDRDSQCSSRSIRSRGLLRIGSRSRAGCTAPPRPKTRSISLNRGRRICWSRTIRSRRRQGCSTARSPNPSRPRIRLVIHGSLALLTQPSPPPTPRSPPQPPRTTQHRPGPTRRRRSRRSTPRFHHGPRRDRRCIGRPINSGRWSSCAATCPTMSGRWCSNWRFRRKGSARTCWGISPHWDPVRTPHCRRSGPSWTSHR
ncbi:MAG: hypothetical protein R3B90_09145 [Planctomycetaceae bacterium]